MSDLRQLRDYFLRDVWLLDVLGRSVQTTNFSLVPCALEFPVGKPRPLPFPAAFLQACPLSHWLVYDDEPSEESQPHVIWLRGRLAWLFGISSPFAQEITEAFQTAFVAVDRADESLRIYPFMLYGGGVGDYGACETDFKMAFAVSVGREARELITADVLTLLTADYQVTEYSDYLSDAVDVFRVSLTDTSARITSLNGQTITDDFDEIPDDHAGFGYFRDRECLDCGGTGEEYITYPIRQTCETCNGDGRVHW